ncbi:hypothetical protein D3C84_735490 [compost metagenome]
MECHVGFIEKLRSDHQRIGALPGLLCRPLGTLAVGFSIAQPTVDDDQHALDFRRRRADAHRHLTFFQQESAGADLLDPMLGSLGTGASKQYS